MIVTAADDSERRDELFPFRSAVRSARPSKLCTAAIDGDDRCTLGRVEPGVVEVALTYRADLTQQQGDRFVATGHVVRAGQTITVCSGDMVAYGEPGERLVATMLATVFAAPERDGLKQ